jgi:hypothetical protein
MNIRQATQFHWPNNWQQYPFPFIDGHFDSSFYPVAQWREASRLALGGFASKMGLASGPAITAMLLGNDNYQLIIIVSTVVMLLTAITIWVPAKLQDHVKTD